MNGYDMYIYTIFICKLIMVLSAITYHIIRHTHISHDTKERIQNIKNIFEFLFVFLMSLLLLYVFNPRNHVHINYETKLLFFLLGIILLITAKYGIFFKDSKNTVLFERIQGLFGN